MNKERSSRMTLISQDLQRKCGVTVELAPAFFALQIISGRGIVGAHKMTLSII